jgi:speckle-type POZ protein
VHPHNLHDALYIIRQKDIIAHHTCKHFILLKPSDISIGLFLSKGSSRYSEETHLMLAAIYNNRLNEIIEEPMGHWGTTFWDTVSTFGTSSTYPVFHVIIDHRKLQLQTAITHGQQQILNHLSKLLDTETMADVNFIVKGQEVKAHSAIVVSGSPVMVAMFETGKFQKSLTKKVEIKDIDPSIFRQMPRYLYTGEAPKLEWTSQTELLFLAADKYQIDGLKKICEESLVDNLCLRNAVHLLVLADLHYSTKLFEGSLNCLKKNKKDIWNRPEWKQLMENYPDLFFQLIKFKFKY